MSYIKLDRRIKEWQWKKDPNMMALWIHLLLEANYAENNWKGNVIPSGTFPTTIKKLSEETGLSIQQTRTCLRNLQSTREITITSTNKYSLITIVKWADYQGSKKKPTTKTTNRGTGNQQTINTQTNNTIRNKEYKEYKNIRNTNTIAYINNNIPTYSAENNIPVSKQEEMELLALMKGTNESKNF